MFYWQQDQSKIQQGPTSRKRLKVEIIAVKGSMAVISSGATFFFHAHLSKLRHSRERTGAPALRLSCEGKIDVWEIVQTMLI